MQRTIILSIALVLSVSVLARELPFRAGSLALAKKPESLLFVFLSVDREHQIAILRPMIAPDIGVQLDSGPRQLAPGTVLTCEMIPREHDAIVEGQIAKVSEMVLDCAEHKFVVKTLDFTPQRH